MKNKNMKDNLCLRWIVWESLPGYQ